MKSYIFYRESDGFITRRLTTDDWDTPIPNVGESYIESDLDIDGHYVDINVSPVAIVPKSLFPDGTMVNDYFTVTVPVGTTAVWQGQRYTVNDGLLEVLIDQVGDFLLVVYHPHYITREYEIEN